ncbi:type 1 phosphatases regulator YPI1 [Drosophila rhopaloa]|uniref:E3 ubiquitin-protein ligase PPP1R11 n=1 Tax=Drosophila rhopaloa TaxID=1041015 RepID=A0A6P4FN76_DRORH|nr:type 1 phosphatases regulator YPI1 [Drosophila rhopaloa]
MDQPTTKASTIDPETEARTSRKAATTTTRTIPGTLPLETDSGFSSADSSDSVHHAPATPCLLRLRLAHQEPAERRVGFHAGVIDNEHMNRRKSKCCCIYRKPHPFGESSSSTDDECEHCFGHPEVKARNRLEKQRKKRQQTCSCCCCCANHRHHQDNRNNRLPIEEIAGDNRNNRLPIEEIAGERDDNQAKEEQKSVINEPNGEEFKKE